MSLVEIDDLEGFLESDVEMTEVEHAYCKERLALAHLHSYGKCLIEEMTMVLDAINEQALKIDAILEKPGCEEH